MTTAQMTSTLPPSATAPHQAREGLGRGFVLALMAHAALLLGLAYGVNWRTQEPQSGAQAELWSQVPQAAPAAPMAADPVVVPITPPPPLKVKPPQPKPVPEPSQPEAQIATQKKPKAEKKTPLEDTQEAQKREQKKEQELEKKRLAEAKAEKAQKDRLDAAAKAEKIAKLENAKKQEAARDTQRQANLKRMLGLANGAEEGSSGGSAQRSSGPSAGYAGRIKARIKPNVTFTESINGNPTAVVEIRLSPEGRIVSSRITQSSGAPSWDAAVLRAVEKTEMLPRDTDGTVPDRMQLVFRPSEL